MREHQVVAAQRGAGRECIFEVRGKHMNTAVKLNKPGDFAESERYYREAISLPMYFGLQQGDQDFVISKLEEIIQ